MTGPERSRRPGHLRVRTVARAVAGTLMVGGGIVLLIYTYLEG